MGKAYDHRIKTQIALTGNPHLFSDINIPRTTRATWVSRGVPDYVQLDEDVVREAFLRDRVDKLERRVATLRAVVVLLVSLIRVMGLSLKHARVPAEGKARLLRTVAAARPAIGFTGALKVIGLSSSRYTEWERRARGCALEDQSSCPHSHPFMLLPRERFAMKGMVLNLELRHMSLRGLALHAQRVGTVFCHPSTWYKMIRRYEWKRPRTRIEPNKPKHGVRILVPRRSMASSSREYMRDYGSGVPALVPSHCSRAWSVSLSSDSVVRRPGTALRRQTECRALVHPPEPALAPTRNCISPRFSVIAIDSPLRKTSDAIIPQGPLNCETRVVRRSPDSTRPWCDGAPFCRGIWKPDYAHGPKKGADIGSAIEAVWCRDRTSFQLAAAR